MAGVEAIQSIAGFLAVVDRNNPPGVCRLFLGSGHAYFAMFVLGSSGTGSAFDP